MNSSIKRQASEAEFTCVSCGIRTTHRFCTRCARRAKRIRDDRKNSASKAAAASILLMSLTLTSCGIFSNPDMTPALEASAGLQRSFDSTSKAFEAFVMHPKVKMAPELRTKVIAQLNYDRGNFTRIRGGLDSLLAKIGEGSIDWRVLYRKAKDIFKGENK